MGQLIHILRAEETTTAKEKEQLATLDKHQKKYLSRRFCWGCEWPLDNAGCGAYGGMSACPESSRIERRERCLAEYKPRYNRRKKVKSTDAEGE